MTGAGVIPRAAPSGVTRSERAAWIVASLPRTSALRSALYDELAVASAIRIIDSGIRVRSVVLTAAVRILQRKQISVDTP